MKTLAVFAVLLGVIAIFSPRFPFGQSNEAAHAIATNYVTYRNAAMMYAVNHTDSTGILETAILGLPPHWRALRSWKNRIEAHTLYVYGKATSQEIVAAEVLLKGSFAVGVNKNSHLVTMHGTGVALPSFIPEGDLVCIITVK
ncbi:MAG: type IV pilus biogenesis protein PilM [Halodesulfovibrio sp.]|uniref:type IV pilus biogenesis protein PilM n=1 Tax=Halodesulfovibrio sp. TaxID=1912772 RepID=UPI00359EFFA2